MPVTDPDKRNIIKLHLFDIQICRRCYARNALNAKHCRRCRSPRLRPKRRERAG